MKSRMYWNLLGEALATTPEGTLPMACASMFESNLHTSTVEQILLCYISSSRLYAANATRDDAVLRVVVQEALHHGFELHAQTILDGRSDTLGEHLVALVSMDATMSKAAANLLQILIETTAYGHAWGALARLSSATQH